MCDACNTFVIDPYGLSAAMKAPCTSNLGQPLPNDCRPLALMAKWLAEHADDTRPIFKVIDINIVDTRWSDVHTDGLRWSMHRLPSFYDPYYVPVSCICVNESYDAPGAKPCLFVRRDMAHFTSRVNGMSQLSKSRHYQWGWGDMGIGSVYTTQWIDNTMWVSPGLQISYDRDNNNIYKCQNRNSLFVPSLFFKTVEMPAEQIRESTDMDWARGGIVRWVNVDGQFMWNCNAPGQVPYVYTPVMTIQEVLQNAVDACMQTGNIKAVDAIRWGLWRSETEVNRLNANSFMMGYCAGTKTNDLPVCGCMNIAQYNQLQTLKSEDGLRTLASLPCYGAVCNSGQAYGYPDKPPGGCPAITVCKNELQFNQVESVNLKGINFKNDCGVKSDTTQAPLLLDDPNEPNVSPPSKPNEPDEPIVTPASKPNHTLFIIGGSVAVLIILIIIIVSIILVIN